MSQIKNVKAMKTSSFLLPLLCLELTKWNHARKTTYHLIYMPKDGIQNTQIISMNNRLMKNKWMYPATSRRSTWTKIMNYTKISMLKLLGICKRWLYIVNIIIYRCNPGGRQTLTELVSMLNCSSKHQGGFVASLCLNRNCQQHQKRTLAKTRIK